MVNGKITGYETPSSDAATDLCWILGVICHGWEICDKLNEAEDEINVSCYINTCNIDPPPPELKGHY